MNADGGHPANQRRSLQPGRSRARSRRRFPSSTNGVLAYSAHRFRTSPSWCGSIGPAAQLGPALQSGNFVNFRLSPDEQPVAVTRIDTLNNTSDIWLAEFATIGFDAAHAGSVE